MSRARLVLCVLVPFAAGYYLSYLFRSVNALIAGDLQVELDLSAADLGALTSAYFLVFAAVLLPCGVLLDVLNMGAAFGLQCLSGLIIAQWPADGGHYPAQAHQGAVAAGLALQLISLALFFAPKRRVQPIPMAHAVARELGIDASAAEIIPAHYRAALATWRRHVAHTKRSIVVEPSPRGDPTVKPLSRWLPQETPMPGWSS